MQSFGRKSDLIRHHHTHTGTRNHKCHFPGCGKTFIQTSALTVHIRTHTGEKPHECHMCSKRFSDSSSLARHRKIHSNDRPYPCKVENCDKSFCRKSTLNKHMAREHPDASLSPGTEDSDEEPSSSSQFQGETGFSNADQMSQSSGTEMQSPYIRADMGTYMPNPPQHRRVSQASRAAYNDYYPHTQPSTPSVASWQDSTHSQGQAHPMAARTNRFPMHLKNVNAMQYHDLGPLSAPISHSDHQYRTHHSLPQSACYMPAEYGPTYYHDVSGTQTPVYGPSGVCDGLIHPPMLPSNADTHGDAQRVLQVHVKPEHLAANGGNQAPMSQGPEVYAYATQEYQEPVNLGVTSDLNGHYQLPGTDFNAWAMAEDDKCADTFGEPLPSQIAGQYSF